MKSPNPQKEPIFIVSQLAHKYAVYTYLLFTSSSLHFNSWPLVRQSHSYFLELASSTDFKWERDSRKFSQGKFWGEEEKTHHVYSCIYVCIYLHICWLSGQHLKKNQKNPYNNYWTQIVVYLFRWCTSFPTCRSSLTVGCYIPRALLIFICLALIDTCVYKPWSFLLSSWDVLYSFTFFRI